MSAMMRHSLTKKTMLNGTMSMMTTMTTVLHRDFENDWSSSPFSTEQVACIQGAPFVFENLIRTSTIFKRKTQRHDRVAAEVTSELPAQTPPDCRAPQHSGTGGGECRPNCRPSLLRVRSRRDQNRQELHCHHGLSATQHKLLATRSSTTDQQIPAAFLQLITGLGPAVLLCSCAHERGIPHGGEAWVPPFRSFFQSASCSSPDSWWRRCNLVNVSLKSERSLIGPIFPDLLRVIHQFFLCRKF